MRILVIRLGAMGDVIHTLPAAASLKHSFPGCRLAWVIEPKWRVLLDANPFVDEIIEFDRRSLASILSTRGALRAARFDLAIDFQGLIKSAFVASSAHPDRLFGYCRSQARERLAAWFYSNPVEAHATHIVERHLELAAAAGARTLLKEFPLPQGKLEEPLPEGRFILASPLAGWESKQWPIEHYAHLAGRLYREIGIPLVVNGAPAAVETLCKAAPAQVHVSSLDGLIDATRRAAAVVGVDSGPLHLAAALGKPGVALYGPTDPARNGPYGGSLRTIRGPGAVTSYKRRMGIDPSLRAISPDEVFDALKAELDSHAAGKAQQGSLPAR